MAAVMKSSIGTQRVLGSLADTSGEMLGSGEIVFTRNVNVLMGELSGEISPRSHHIARTIDASGVRAAVTVKIQGCVLQRPVHTTS